MEEKSLENLMLQARSMGKAVRLVISRIDRFANGYSASNTAHNKLLHMADRGWIRISSKDRSKINAAKSSAKKNAYIWQEPLIDRTLVVGFEEGPDVDFMIEVFAVQGGHSVERAEIVDTPSDL